MSSLLQFLMERAPTEAVKLADILASFIVSKIDVEEMRANRGKDYATTSMYQLRIKPNDRETELQSILTKLDKVLKSAEAKKLGVKNVQINDVSVNSSKYSSVSFTAGESDYDIVVAKGGNGGEHFEQDLLLSMDNLVAGIENTEQATKAFMALQGVDPAFKLSNVVSVSKRTGTTKRSGDLTPSETGKIIGDVIVTLKKGGDKYISVKDINGKTVAQFGLAKAFNDDLTVNTTSQEWKTWLQPFGLDAKKISEGLKAAQAGTEVSFPDTEEMEKNVKPGSAVQTIMEKMWGCDYYYLRKNGKDFKALKIDKAYVDNELLKNLKVTKLNYPSSVRKQINIYLESESMKFKLEVRNPRGKGSVKPTQIQLTIMKSVK
jgi:tetrahydromethanopterin S-methyltransferase subunit B